MANEFGVLQMVQQMTLPGQQLLKPKSFFILWKLRPNFLNIPMIIKEQPKEFRNDLQIGVGRV